jgi:Flp pilus assembly protein TadG
MSYLVHPNRRRTTIHQHGVAIVEFALVLTLLITIMAGIFEVGRAFWYYDALTKATRDGARLMAVAPKANLTTAVTGGIATTKIQVADSVTAAGVPSFTNANVAVTCLDAAFNDSTCVNGIAPGGIRVQITGFTLTIGQFIPFLLGASSNYSASLTPHTTMRYMPELF